MLFWLQKPENALNIFFLVNISDIRQEKYKHGHGRCDMAIGGTLQSLLSGAKNCRFVVSQVGQM